jgi:hypothetical protein
MDMTTKTNKPATAAQGAFMARLVAERDPEIDAVKRALAYIHADIKGESVLTKNQASTIIDILLSVPAMPSKAAVRKNNYPNPCTACGVVVLTEAGRIEKTTGGKWLTYHLDGECATDAEKAEALALLVTEPGMYRKDGVNWKVKFNQRKSHLNAFRVVVHTHDHIGHGPKHTVDFVYERNAVNDLTTEDKMTFTEAREFGALYATCINCAAALGGETEESDKRAVTAGYGATCAKNNGWPFVTAGQAKAIIAGTLTFEDAVGDAW